MEVSLVDSVRAFFAEMIAVLFFVYFSTMTAMFDDTTLVIGAFGHGLIIFILVTMTASVSGGHVNPSVTIGVCIGGGMPVWHAPCYMVAQIVGGILGSLLTLGCVGTDAFEKGKAGATLLGDNVSVGGAIGIEILMTFLLVNTVLMTAVNNESKVAHAPLCIGLSITAVALCAGPFTGASMNIARSFGPAVVASMAGIDAWDNHWVYWIATPIGAALAGVLYRVLYAGEDQRWGGSKSESQSVA